MEDVLRQAERHVRDGEERVTQQAALLAELERHNHLEAAADARELLQTLEQTLHLMRRHLRMELEERGLKA